MVWKQVVKFGLVPTVIFLVLFVYFYTNSGNFRKSIIGAFMILTFYLGYPIKTYAAGEADGFIPPHQQHPRPKDGPGFFSQSRSSSSGPEKPDDFDNNNAPDSAFPKTESVEDTEKRVARMEENLREMSEITDSDSESEEDYPSAVTLEEALALPDIKTFEEAKEFAETNLPKNLEVDKNHYVSGVVAAKKCPHAPEIGINPADYDMKPEHVNLIRGMGLYNYLQKGYPLPPSDFVEDYQQGLKDICLDSQTSILNDKPYTHNYKTPISIYENKNMSKSGKSSAIVVFDDSENGGDMITLGKRGKSYMKKVKDSGNMGTGGGTL